METLPCGHVARVGGSRLCLHLLTEEGRESLRYVRVLTGDGVRFDAYCQACGAAEASAPLLSACEGCAAAVSGSWRCAGWRDEAGIRQRPEPIDSTVALLPLPPALGPVADLAPLPGDGPVWAVLTAAGGLVRFDSGSSLWTPLGTCTVPVEADDDPFNGRHLRRRLHVSPAGEYAAVVNDYGRYGEVIDLTTGQVTMQLDGGDYHGETVPFSFSFAVSGERTLVLHRTDWNRLDISDPATGELLTGRGPTAYRAGEERPAHYLDYFHGALSISPDGRLVLDDGWFWQPVGIPTVWDLQDWVAGNVWESEDGPSRRGLCQRDYAWDRPTCWLTDDLLAISGIGDDDQAMLTGVELFDVARNVRVGAFAGPDGTLFEADGQLLAAAPDGLQRWDPATGELTGTVPGFVPTHRHPAGELVAVEDGVLRRWNWRG